MRIVTWIARLVMALTVLGLGYLAFDAVQSKRSKSKTAAPFGDNHYESIKKTFPENASDADTAPMQEERRRITQK